ncbi:hypothetical protein IQ241_22825 [Romeria aff. gracilis LEGE 07310]|uniref:Uncharacterized protein n=1 Tax=Vasconcelosia minhoensis LEGE 07310 TaxID=915328 RepID=A0A8J7DPQ3_9CYAN|nr:hypothetical protein [Romeria gracilis]MBE9080090.1 hypothetical protein [Romeria aff. gracilis LEGE 07310]
MTQKLQDKDDIQLVCQPTEVLTAQFRADLETITDRQIVLLFDAFEHTGEILERWLLEILAGKHGRLPPNCIWVIAGLNQLDSVVWSGYEPVELQLIPFTPEEATKFLQNSGVSVLNEISIILEGSGCLPLLLAVLTKNAHNHPALMGDTNEMMRSFLQSALNQR